MVVKEVKNHFDPVEKITNVLIENGVSINTVLKHKSRIVKILKEYSNKVKFKKGPKVFIREVIQKLSKT